MPIYEYQCRSCGHELEKMQRMSDSELRDCPDCGEAELRRLVSAAGFRLKGAGWYETDFKQGRKKNLHGAAESSSSSAKEKSPETGNSGPSSNAGKSANSATAGSSESA